MGLRGDHGRGVSVLLALTVMIAAPATAAVELEETSRFGGRPGALTLSTSAIVLATGDTLTVLDPTGTSIVETARLELACRSLAAAGDTVVCLERDALSVLEIADGTPPVLRGRAALTSSSYDSAALALDGQLALVADEIGLTVVDISVPAAPAAVVSEATIDGVRIAAGDGWAYLSAPGSHALQVVDLSDPTAPALVTTIDTVVENLTLADGLLLTTGGPQNGARPEDLQIFDLADPAVPAVLAALDLDSGGADQLAVDGALVFLAGRGTVVAVDITNPAAPLRLGEHQWHGSYVPALAATNGSLYLADTDATLLELDVSQPAQPIVQREVAAVRVSAWLAAAGTDLWIAAADGLWRYDLADPAAPAVPDHFAAWQDSTLIEIDGALAFVADGDGVVHLLDIANPAAPRETASYQPAGATRRLAPAAGGLLLLVVRTDAGDLLEVVDVADPAAPVARGSVALPGSGYGIDAPAAGAIAGVAYHADSGQGLAVVDLSEPATPVLAGTVATAGWPSSVWLDGVSAVVASRESSVGTWYVELFDLADPAAPVRRDVVSGSGGIAWDVAGAGEDVLVTIQQDGDNPDVAGVYSFTLEHGQLRAGARTEGNRPLALALLAPAGGAKAPADDCLTIGVSGGLADWSPVGEYGNDGIRVYRGCGPPQTHELVTEILPEAARGGCSVDPARGSHSYPDGRDVTVNATAGGNWNFARWSGDASGTSPSTTVRMDSDKLVYANFVSPTLTVTSTTLGPQCPTFLQEWRQMEQVTISVDDAADWEITGIALAAYGNGDEGTHVNDVRVYRGRDESLVQIGSGWLSDDDGTATITFSPAQMLTAGSSLTLQVFYYLNTYSSCPIRAPGWLEYGISVRGPDVAGQPIAPAYEHYAKLPLEHPPNDTPTRVACVVNTSRRLTYLTIGDALTDAGPGQTIELCPGTFAECLAVGVPGVTLRGRDGRGADTFRSRLTAACDDAVTVTVNRVTLDNLDIQSTVTGGRGVVASDRSDLYLGFCRVTADSAAGTAIAVTGCLDCELDLNTVEGATHVSGRNARIRRNTFHGTLEVESQRARITDNQLDGSLVLTHSDHAGISGNQLDHPPHDGIAVADSDYVTVTTNTVRAATTSGVHLERTNYGSVTNNQLVGNCQGITLEEASNSIVFGNQIEDGTCNTGLVLAAASPLITGNQVSGDEGDAIRCANGATPTITANNIAGNAGLGLDNLDPMVTIDARGNWWGDTTGPAGQGPGSGDAVSEYVDFTPWRDQPMALVAAHRADEVAAPAGSTALSELLLRSWAVADDTVTLVVSDTLGWSAEAVPAVVELDAGTGGAAQITIAIPADAVVGSRDTVTVTATAAADPDHPVTRDVEVVVAEGWAWRVPVVAHSQGFGGTAWRSDVAAVNPGASEASVTLVLRQGGITATATQLVPPGGAVEWADVLTRRLGLDEEASSAASLQLTADLPLAITSRTYADAGASGTYGQFEPALGSGDGLSPGTVGYLPQLKKTAQLYTNIGMVNLGATPCTVRVRLFDGAGHQLGDDLGRTLAIGEWRQLNDVFGDASLATAYATCEVAGAAGRAWCYASVVDATTSDPTTIPVIVPPPAGASWIPGIAHASGFGGTAWRSAVAAVNPTAAAVQLEVRYHARGVVASRSATLAAGAASEWRDVLVDLLGLAPEDNSAGCLELVADGPLAIAARTYADGGANGTYGQYEPALAGADLVAAGVLPQLRSDGRFYTNIGAVNAGASAASFTVRLYGADGEQLGAALESGLPAGEWRQLNQVFTLAGAVAAGPAYATIAATPADAAVWFYASVIDATTRDPTTIPVQVSPPRSRNKDR